MLRNLAPRERAALLELGRNGAGGHFDHTVMSKLFTLGLVEIRSRDRRLVLTNQGREVYDQLSADHNDRTHGIVL